MTTPTWQEARTAASSADYRTALLASCVAQGCTISGWPDAAPQRALIEGESHALSFEASTRAALAATASPDTCKVAGSTWVDAVLGWFKLPNGQGGFGRIQGTKAIWSVPLIVAPGGAPLTVTNTSAIQLQAEDGTFFDVVQAAAVTLNTASSYRGQVAAVARRAGTSGNVLTGSITKIVSAPGGLSVDLGGTQSLQVAARDQETDDQYIARGLGSWARLGAGWIRLAFDFLIPFYGNGNGNGNAVTRWTINDSNPNGPGTVEVAIANDAGAASVAEVAAVAAGLQGLAVNPVGSGALSVVAATAHPLTITANLVTDGSNPSVGTQAGAALHTLARVFPLGVSTLPFDLAIAVLMGAPIVSATIKIGGGKSKKITLNLPGFDSVEKITGLSLIADEVLAYGEVLGITPSLTVA